MTTDEKIDLLLKEVSDIRQQLGLKRKIILTVDDVTQICNRSKIWVYKLVKEQSIPFYKSRGRLHFKYSEIEKWWNENRYKPYE